MEQHRTIFKTQILLQELAWLLFDVRTEKSEGKEK